MSEIFVTADWHVGEDRFELMGRPFVDKQQHINHLVFEHNAKVNPEDLVYVVGDAVYQKAPEYLSSIPRFNGRKILIRGNHDRVFTDEQLKPYFEQIIPEGQGIEYMVHYGEENEKIIPCYITHYPSEGKGNMFNLVGHIHAAWKYQLNCFNIGVDANHFRPTNLNTIPFHFNAISSFYDDDVWVAYKNLNFLYKDKRGKKGTYFKPALPTAI